MCCLYLVSGFPGYSLCGGLYGLLLGSYLYSHRILGYSVINHRRYSIIQSCQAIPAIIGTTLTGRTSHIITTLSSILAGYINQYYDKAGYWVSIFFVILGSILLAWLWDREKQIPTVDEGDVSNNEIIDRNHMNKLKVIEVKGNAKISDMNDNLSRVSRLSYSDPVLHGRDNWYTGQALELLTTTV